MADKTIYWAFPDLPLEQRCNYANATAEVKACFFKGKCDKVKGVCKCTHKYGDSVSNCEHSIFDVYLPSAMAFPIVLFPVITSLLKSPSFFFPRY